MNPISQQLILQGGGSSEFPPLSLTSFTPYVSSGRLLACDGYEYISPIDMSYITRHAFTLSLNTYSFEGLFTGITKDVAIHTITYGGGKFVMGGDPVSTTTQTSMGFYYLTGFAYSTNVSDWSLITVDTGYPLTIKHIIWTGTKFVALLQNENQSPKTIFVMDSIDGITWSNKTYVSSSYSDVYSISYSSQASMYVIVGGDWYAYSSTITGSWYTVSTSGMDITSRRNEFFTITQNEILKSYNGSSFLPVFSFTGSSEYHKIANSNFNIVALSSNKVYYTNDTNDGSTGNTGTWNTTTVLYSQPQSIIWDGSKYVSIYQEVNYGLLKYTVLKGQHQYQDGSSWSDNSDLINLYTSIIYVNGKFYCCQRNMINNSTYSISVRDDFMTEIYRYTTQYPTLNIIYGGGKFVAVGQTIYTSTDDAYSWTQQGIVLTNDSFIGVSYSGNIYVATTNLGSIFSSADGINWTFRRTILNSQFMFGLAWNGSYFLGCAVDASTYETIFVKSYDGINWTDYKVSGIYYSTDITWTGNFWCIVGSFGYNAISTDGINWTISSSIYSTRYSRNLLLPYYAPFFYRVKFIDNKLFAVSTLHINNGEHCSGLFQSTDGLNWTEVETGAYYQSINTIYAISRSSSTLILGGDGFILMI